jgi:SlyX protein
VSALHELEKRLVDLEVRYAHQERMLHDLSDVLFAQERTIERLTVALEAMRDQQVAERESRDERPPHY